ncbi:Alcohol dehydrogenase [Salipiger mucosus DSM 16094]|uniref:Alcohol dehydrogenase n=1 Tax=Salipiger mucosus DSM 16094 TaxID=1123237 RepID=S9RN28_9RHOB|nr:Alcohol dehydrogenase [Salipiger mucosus DSM 16094]
MSLIANWSYPTAVRFGAGRISELAEACKAAGMSKPLLVTDKGLADLPITKQALDILKAAGLEADLFAEVDPNPNERNLGAGVVAFKQGRHDGVVAFGGGSGLDLGKCVAFMAGQTRPVWDFEDIGDWCMSLIANWSYPTAVRFGAGRISELAEACKAAGMSKPLLVTDKGLADLPITKQALDILKAAGLEADLFAEVDPNPNERNLGAGVVAFKQGRHDGVVAFGGGSGLDLGKCVAFMAGQTRPVWDFEDIGDWWTRADASAIAPIVAVPTTAGTGSEVGRAGVLTNSETHEKKIIFHPKMLPATVICDPELTVGMPKAITAGTGLDAFAHCVEAFSSPHYHPMSQGIALEGMRLVVENLPRAFEQPDDIEARAPHDERRRHGRHRLPEGAGRDPRAEPPGRRAFPHPPRHDQRGLHARGAGVQRPRDRRPFRQGDGLPRYRGRFRRFPRLCRRTERTARRAEGPRRARRDRGEHPHAGQGRDHRPLLRRQPGQADRGEPHAALPRGDVGTRANLDVTKAAPIPGAAFPFAMPVSRHRRHPEQRAALTPGPAERRLRLRPRRAARC